MKLDIIDREYIDKAMFIDQIQTLCEKLIELAFDNCLKQDYDNDLSQNLLAVTPNCQNWLFLRPNTGSSASVSTPYSNLTKAISRSKRYPLMVWLILQNKPFGEYVERLLTEPRVGPRRPNLGYFLNKLLGAFNMNAVTSKETFFINIPSLGLVFNFETKADALAFAEKAQKQYPEHKVERWVNRQFTDSWDEVYIVDSVKGNIHKVFTDKQKAVAYYERLAMEFADTIIYTSEWSEEAISALEGR